MSQPREYMIRSVEDFLAVPEQSRAACLRDFADWLGFAANSQALRGGLGLDACVQFDTRVFCWVDDGKAGTNGIKVVTPDGRTIDEIDMVDLSQLHALAWAMQ